LAINRQFLINYPDKSIALVDRLVREIDQQESEEKSTFFTPKNAANPLTRPASEN
jgi:hypothetical protein